VVVFDPQRPKRLQVDTLHERCDWTPYAGMEIRGWPRTVLLHGRPVVLDEVFCGDATGRFVARRFD
jgi:dihydropyrimidinase